MDWWWTSNALPGVKTVNYRNYRIIRSRKSFINSSILLYGEQAMFYKALKLLITARSQPACRSLLIYSFVAFSIGRMILNTNHNIEDQLRVICGCTSFTDVHLLAVKCMYWWFEIRWQNMSHHSTVGVHSVQGVDRVESAQLSNGCTIVNSRDDLPHLVAAVTTLWD